MLFNSNIYDINDQADEKCHLCEGEKGKNIHNMLVESIINNRNT